MTVWKINKFEGGSSDRVESKRKRYRFFRRITFALEFKLNCNRCTCSSNGFCGTYSKCLCYGSTCKIDNKSVNGYWHRSSIIVLFFLAVTCCRYNRIPGVFEATRRQGGRFTCFHHNVISRSLISRYGAFFKIDRNSGCHV